jgi:hypothetical protein
MKQKRLKLAVFVWMMLVIISPLVSSKAEVVVRPEEIKSKRLVIYDDETYAKLARLWKVYYDAYPSEYAYANWMYAARYAGEKNYSGFLDKGLKKYPANPALLYLKGCEKQGAHNNMEGRRYLERSVALDPGYVDPWFALVVNYMDEGDEERVDIGLRRLLESGVVTDEVMDYNYNVLASLDKNAILITNGDNDTYPVWILTRILKIRPDISVVNRSLLNTDWYPMYIIEHGMPRFIGKSELDNLRSSILQGIKNRKESIPPSGPFGDTLIFKIIESAQSAGRPVYLSRTLYITDRLKGITEKGRELGLVTLVTPSQTPYAEQLQTAYGKWMEAFRTGGLDSWRLEHSPKADAGRQLVSNYATGSVMSLDSLRLYAPELRVKLFRWYLNHVDKLLSEEFRGHIMQVWCQQSDVQEIETWCRQKGIKP